LFKNANWRVPAEGDFILDAKLIEQRAMPVLLWRGAASIGFQFEESDRKTRREYNEIEEPFREPVLAGGELVRDCRDKRIGQAEYAPMSKNAGLNFALGWNSTARNIVNVPG